MLLLTRYTNITEVKMNLTHPTYLVVFFLVDLVFPLGLVRAFKLILLGETLLVVIKASFPILSPKVGFSKA